MRISDWSSDVCSSDLVDDEKPEELLEQRTIASRTHRRLVQPRQEEEQKDRGEHRKHAPQLCRNPEEIYGEGAQDRVERPEIPFRHNVRGRGERVRLDVRSEEHTSELQSLMRISYAVFCLKKKK